MEVRSASGITWRHDREQRGPGDPSTDEDIHAWEHARPRPGGRRPHAPAGHAGGDHGPLGLRQDDAPALPRGRAAPQLRVHHPGRRGNDDHVGARPVRPAPAPLRLRVPGRPAPARAAHGREHRDAPHARWHAKDSGARPRPRNPREPRPRRRRPLPPRPAVGRPGAARRDRPSARHRSLGDLRGRADGCPRPGNRRRGHVPPDQRLRLHGSVPGPRHPRPRGGRTSAAHDPRARRSHLLEGRGSGAADQGVAR